MSCPENNLVTDDVNRSTKSDESSNLVTGGVNRSTKSDESSNMITYGVNRSTKSDESSNLVTDGVNRSTKSDESSNMITYGVNSSTKSDKQRDQLVQHFANDPKCSVQEEDIVHKAELATEDELELGLYDFDCTKNPGHQGFIPFNELDYHHIQRYCDNLEVLEDIKHVGKRVVKLVITDENGGQSCASGWVLKENGEYFIITNNHVIKDDVEAVNCDVEFNYESMDISRVIYSKGVRVVATNPHTDQTRITFWPVPEFISTMDIFDNELLKVQTEVIYENGEVVKKECHLVLDQTIYFKQDLSRLDVKNINVKLYDGSLYEGEVVTYYIPIFTNQNDIMTFLRYMLSANKGPQLHVDYVKAGNVCRVLSTGHMFTAVPPQLLITLPEQVSREEAGTCRVHLPDGSVRHSLGFSEPHVKLTRILNNETRPDLSVDNKSRDSRKELSGMIPVPNYLTKWHEERKFDFIGCTIAVIGHPHGFPKMITFGRFHKLDHNQESCSHFQYTSRTCPGSSGSLVIGISDSRSNCVRLMTHSKGLRAEDAGREVTDTGNINTSMF